MKKLSNKFWKGLCGLSVVHLTQIFHEMVSKKNIQYIRVCV